ncbi:MAG: GtrA family protein [Actinomycetota bacterium]
MLTQLRQSKVYVRLHGHEIVRQFVKYAMVGVLNVGLYLAIFNILLLTDIHVLAANAVAFSVSSVNSFLLNKIWSFRDQRRHGVLRQYFTFVFFTLVGLGLNTGVLSLLLIPLDRFGTLGKNAAALGSVPVSVLWNFTSYRLWTFKDPKRGHKLESRT